jgi:hypothetical protein
VELGSSVLAYERHIKDEVPGFLFHPKEETSKLGWFSLPKVEGGKWKFKFVLENLLHQGLVVPRVGIISCGRFKAFRFFYSVRLSTNQTLLFTLTMIHIKCWLPSQPGD